MKLARYRADGQPRIGIVDGDAIVDAGDGALDEVMADWPSAKGRFEALLDSGERRALDSVELLAPVARPGKIFAIGLNYADHAAESKMDVPTRQVWFTKAVTSINDPFAPIMIARNGPFVDYEVELVAIVGRRGRNIPADRAAEHVFGYCVGNDVTERFWQHATPQWSLGKSFDTHAPIGPWITTADEVSDPHGLGVRCLVNGEERQSSNTRQLIFSVWDQIAHLSQAMTLEPGDLLFTGTPSGVGAAMDPRVFLKEGDVVRCEIDSLGAIEARLVKED